MFTSVRYHSLIEPMLNQVPDLTVIVRHPCDGVTESFRPVKVVVDKQSVIHLSPIVYVL